MAQKRNLNTNKKLTAAQRVDLLINTAKEEMSDKEEREMVGKITSKLEDLKKAKLIVANIERDIEEMKLELASNLEAIDNA